MDGSAGAGNACLLACVANDPLLWRQTCVYEFRYLEKGEDVVDSGPAVRRALHLSQAGRTGGDVVLVTCVVIRSYFGAALLWGMHPSSLCNLMSKHRVTI